jgi:hypothetical protein
VNGEMAELRNGGMAELRIRCCQPAEQETPHAPRTTPGLDTSGKQPPDYSTDVFTPHAPRTTPGLDTSGKQPPDYSTDVFMPHP